jgi:hypothetical protein
MPVSVAAIEITDYVDPNSFYDEAYLTGRFSLNSGNQDRTSYDGSASGYYDVTQSTLPFSWNIRGEGNLNFSQSGIKKSTSDDDKLDDTEKYYDFSVASYANKYLTPQTNELFAYGSLDLGYRRQQGLDDDDDPYLKLGGGVGFGRVFNATPLADALRIVEALTEYGIVIRQPSDQTYLAMANIIARESEFKSQYGLVDYKQFWFTELENVLQRAGVLRNNTLGAAGVIKMHEVLLQERISIRKHGWMVRGGIGYVASNYDGSDSAPSIDAAFEYALPIGHRFQFLELAKYSTILNDELVHQFSNTMSATYEVSDRIDWENSWDLNMTFPNDDDAKDRVTNQLRSIFHYYLSNRISADFSVTFTHVEDDIDDNNNDDVETSIFMGITYRLR